MGSPFESISCSIRHDGARIITWKMHPGADYPLEMKLQIENARAGEQWEVLCEDVCWDCAYVDSRKRNYNKRLDECYRVRMILPRGEEWLSDVVDAGNYKAYPYSAEAENVVTQLEQAVKQSGVTGKLLKRRTWGVRCPDCTDFGGQQTVNEHCPRCLGTGIDGGYFPGLALDMIKDSTETSATPSQTGYLQGESVKARCIAYPWIAVGDVWVEDGSDKRFVIAATTPSASYRQTDLVYTVLMNRVELSDALHSESANRLVQGSHDWAKAPASMPDHVTSSRVRDEWDEVLSQP